MRSCSKSVCWLGALVALANAPCLGEEWSRFRGPNGSGVASDSGYPVEFDKTKNVLWRTPVRPGNSSPILTERHVFLTGAADGKLYTQCFDRSTGELVWERFVPREREEIEHQRNSAAANTPVTDGENVYVLFRDFGLMSYSADGDLRWKLPLGPFDNFMGLASSPILYEDSVILLADRRTGSFIASYRTSNGELNWKASRGDLNGWTTPILYHAVDGEPQIVTAASHELNAHSAVTGEPSWVHRGTSPAVTPSPVVSGDTVFAFGYGRPIPNPFSGQLSRRDADGDGLLSPEEYGQEPWLTHIAKRYGGRPDLYVTKEAWDAAAATVAKPSALVAVQLGANGAPPRELWRYERSFVGVTPSPILVGGLLYIVKSGGILTAFDAETGAVVKAGRVTGAIDHYWASPVAAEGRLYLASEEGNVAVVEGGKDWKVLAVNALEEPILATPALSEGRVYVRTEAALYGFGEAP